MHNRVLLPTLVLGVADFQQVRKKMAGLVEDSGTKQRINRTGKDEDDGEKEQTNDGSNGEDFISLMPVGDDNDEEDEFDAGTASVDTTGNFNGKRKFDKLKSLPPWMKTYVDYRRVNPLVALHNEIVCFCRLMEPREEELKTREDLVTKFTLLAKSVFPDCKVDIFGSQATGYVKQSFECTTSCGKND